MTDVEIADKVYIESISLPFVSHIIRKNVQMHFANFGWTNWIEHGSKLQNSGILEECGVEVLGTKLSAINRAEDRDLFRELMREN